MSKKIRGLICLMIVCTMLFSSNLYASAKNVNGDVKVTAELVQAYEEIIEYAASNGIPLDLSLDTFLKEYQSSNYKKVSDYTDAYYDVLEGTDFALKSSGGDKWYYNTGTTLPQAADYSSYNLLNTVKRGDIIFEANGGFGITGHTAIVEGIYYSSTWQQYYIRVVEAIDEGVVRSVLDDERVNDKDVTVLRVSGASGAQITGAVDFCLSQLGKAYSLDFQKDTSASESDWYCSELVWAGYYNQGINVETTGLYNEPGITPRDIRNSSLTLDVSFQ